MKERSFDPKHGVVLSLALLGATLLAGCASTQPHSGGAREDSQGIVVGTLTTNCKAEELTRVYARAGSSNAENAGASMTRVILVAEALSSDALTQIAENRWSGGSDVEGVVVDIGADSKWSALFITPFGLQDTYGFTSTGGNAKVAKGRARGRIALSNQSDVGNRAFKASFDISIESETTGNAAGAAAALIGRWRIDEWTDNKGEKYAGDLEFVRQGVRLFASAKIRPDVVHAVVDETFDVRIEGDTAHLYGIVDPDARWTADTLTLRVEGDTLSGESIDDNGNGGSVRFRRVR